METLVVVMIVLLSLDFVVKQTFMKPVYVAVTAVVCALFTGLMCPVATSVSGTVLSGVFSDSSRMLDLAVLVSMDVMAGITFCWLSVQKIEGERMGVGSKILLGVSGYFPGIMVFVILLYLLAEVIFLFPGVSFSLLAWGLAAAVLVAVPLLAWLLRSLLPQVRGRLDLMFMSYVITAMIGVIATV